MCGSASFAHKNTGVCSALLFCSGSGHHWIHFFHCQKYLHRSKHKDQDCCEVRCSSYHTVIEKQPAGPLVGGLCSGVLATALLLLFKHPWDSLSLRVKWIHQKWWQGNMDQTARWREKMCLWGSLLIILNVSDGSTLTHRRELIFCCPPCRCADSDNILPPQLGGSSLKHKRRQ